MRERAISKEEKEDLIRTFEDVLNDFQVVAKSDVEALIEERVADLKKAAEEGEEEAEEEAEDGKYTLADLQARLPSSVYETVRAALTQEGFEVVEAGSAEEAEDVSKSVERALTTSGETLRKVRSEGAPVQEVTPSHESTQEASEPISKTILSQFEDMQPAPIRKESKSKSDNPALHGIDEADL